MAFGLETLKSKNTIWPACQNPRALISSLNSLPAKVECRRYSPVNCCSFGSTRMFLQTSFNNIDVRFLMCLCRKETKPLFLQERTCWISNSQLDASLVNKLFEYLAGRVVHFKDRNWISKTVYCIRCVIFCKIYFLLQISRYSGEGVEKWKRIEKTAKFKAFCLSRKPKKQIRRLRKPSTKALQIIRSWNT